MARFSKKSAAAALMASSGGLAFLLFTQLAAGQTGGQMVNSRTANLTATSIPYIDAHTHIDQRDPEGAVQRSEEHTSELQSQSNLVCRLLLEKKKKNIIHIFSKKKKKKQHTIK